MAAKHSIKVVGRARKTKLVAGGDESIVETLQVNGQTYRFYQTEGAFSQPNAKVCEKMIAWALAATNRLKASTAGLKLGMKNSSTVFGCAIAALGRAFTGNLHGSRRSA